MLTAPDAEGAVVAALAASGLTARDVLLPPWPALRVVRVGGERARIADSALIQLDCANDTGTSKAVTLTRLEQAVSVLRAAEGQTHGGAVIAAVQVSAAPAYLPDVLTGAPRYTCTLLVTSRALAPEAP